MSRRMFVLPIAVLASMTATSVHATNHVEQIACADLTSPTLEACLGSQATASTEKLVLAQRAASEAAGQVCFAVPEPAIGDCLQKAQRKADQALTAAVKQEMERIDSDGASPTEVSLWKRQFKTAQQSWRAFVDLDCSKLIDLEYMHGTGAGAAGSQCVLVKTLQRVEELRVRLER